MEWRGYDFTPPGRYLVWLAVGPAGPSLVRSRGRRCEAAPAAATAAVVLRGLARGKAAPAIHRAFAGCGWIALDLTVPPGGRGVSLPTFVGRLKIRLGRAWEASGVIPAGRPRGVWRRGYRERRLDPGAPAPVVPAGAIDLSRRLGALIVAPERPPNRPESGR